MRRAGASREQESHDAVRRVIVIVFPGVNILDVAGPCEVLNAATAELATRGSEAGGYEIEVVSTVECLSVETSSGVGLTPHGPYSCLEGPIDTLIVTGGPGVWGVAEDPAFLEWLRRIRPSVRRLSSVCTGAFILAAAGLLDGHRAATHWQSCERLAHDYPRIDVDFDAIFVRDGAVSTSAGVTAGMDLVLSFVEEDFGRGVAIQVARKLVMFVHRPGGQSQFSSLLRLQSTDREPLRELQSWMAEHLDADLSVERLASRARMSPRNFARVFRLEAGLPPARFVERLRVEAARRRLEESGTAMERIARECGFGNADSMRRSFLKELGVTPSDYRSRFHSGPAGSRAHRTVSSHRNSHADD
ncbi:GlxA family transcriptional regulator [Singulisphaera sp. Ch08]|uniref:GlxA family transcriptional regulator n=1 Tax=Singulisphaera sp. Ch08 TaxID=3120278 RepID=A0AAU7CJH2_9BACT